MPLDDCLVQPQNKLEKCWRRLSFYLRKEDVLKDSRLAARCTNCILSVVFHGLGVVWDQFLNVAAAHVSFLEGKIYENPADESRAPELSTSQASVADGRQSHVNPSKSRQRDGDDDAAAEVGEISTTPAEYGHLARAGVEDQIHPTRSLSDLTYRSVGIRDSRQSSSHSD